MVQAYKSIEKFTLFKKMELKESCEKYADAFILKAYANGGKIIEEDNSFAKVPTEYSVGVNTLMNFYGILSLQSGVRIYTLNREGMEFARRGAYAGVAKAEIQERSKNKQTRIIAILGLVVAVIVGIVEICKAFNLF